MKTVSIQTLGCRLNQAESAELAARFAAAGFEVVGGDVPSDVVLIHGCAVTRSAEKNTLRLARAAKRRPWKPTVVVAGCPVQSTRDTAALLRDSGADRLADQNAKWRLPTELLPAADSPCTIPFDPAHPVTPRFETTRALVKVQDGCDFRCAYCIVPDARGPSRSRPVGTIVDEVERLCGDRGFREVVLTGANVGCYRDGERRLGDLLYALERVPQLERIRISSIEFSTVERDIIAHMADSEKLCRHLHLPLQSGDDRILRAMGRRYSVGEYKAFVAYAVERVPDLGLGTDVIAGFPGEDDHAFEATFSAIAELPFSHVHAFPYSERPGTPAALLPNRVPVTVGRDRAGRLIRLGRERRRDFARRFVGRSVAVLIEKVTPDGGAGWTGEYLPAAVRGFPVTRNRIVTAQVTHTDGATLFVLA